MYAASYVWAKVLSILERQLSDVVVSAWFDDAEVVELTEKELIVYSPSEFRQEHIRATYAPYVEEALRNHFQSNAKLVVWGETERKANAGRNMQASYFNPQFVFENFIAGAVNEMPLRIASAVAEQPGVESHNPVFFYGPPGVGKTHLLYSIANAVARKYPEKKLVCIKGDQFTNDLVKAIQCGGSAKFREKYREADVLLVDDIQFIAGKDATQEEFFHTFNELYENGKQIVLTADRKPSAMATLEERLRSRFGVGVMVAIENPDLNTRLLITKAKAKQMGLVMGGEVLEYLAKDVCKNVRQIEGSLKKIRAFRDLAGMALTLENVSQTVADIQDDEQAVAVSPGLILRNVCRFYGTEEAILKSSQRSRNVSEPRQVAMFLMRQMTGMSQDEIAKLFGRDRTTVIHALRQVEKEANVKGSKLQLLLQDLQANIAGG